MPATETSPPRIDPSAVNLGLFVKLPSTQAIEIVAGAGFDFCLIDLEHSQLGEADAIALLAHAAAIGLPALARIPQLDRGAVNRLLEAGACGIQLSTVTSAAQVLELRAATRYAPDGERSISLAHARARYGAQTMREYLDAERARPPLLVAQIETASTRDPLAAILAAAPDVAFVGTADLGADLQLDQHAIERRVQEIAGEALAAKVALGGIGLSDPRVRYRVLGADLSLLRASTAGVLTAERERLQARVPGRARR
ncbi:MAG: aldolase/citrate lyase family protein [Solirubrobacteraceae bacterium]